MGYPGGGGASALDDLSDVDVTTSPPSVDEGLVYDGSLWVPGDVASGGGGTDVVQGTYTGDGAAGGQAVSLPAACSLVAVSGYPSDGGQSQAWAAKGLEGIRVYVNTSTGEFSARPGLVQLAVAADGLSFTVDGSGSKGLNESGVSYTYVGIPETVGGGGGSVPVWVQQLIEDQDASAFYDGFTDGDLSAYTQVDGTGAPAGGRTWTEARDLLSLKLNGGDSSGVMHALAQALPGGAAAPFAVETALRFTSQHGVDARFIGGVLLTDGTAHGGANKQVAAMIWHDDSGLHVTMDLRTGSGYTLDSSVGSETWKPSAYGRWYVRLVWEAADTWGVEVSPDGVSWLTVHSGHAFAMTPTHLGVWGTSWAYAGPSVATFENLRGYSTA